MGAEGEREREGERFIDSFFSRDKSPNGLPSLKYLNSQP